ncbi:hypothetical protein [Nocardiopsis lucentensis]|uniref:hypothetical protein n=1 Tax=Nocardiopsis lucentensis TaxID=53441 RepID=UPI00034AFB28|nr:hypothetical protein [Nocardiopsis lucentensis]
MSYYRIDWDALNALPAAAKMQALADIFDQVRSEIGAERGRMVHEAVAEHGTQKAAAEVLGMKTARLGQLYTQYKETHMIEIATVVANYDLLNEVEDQFDSRQAAHEAIQAYLSQVIDIDGEDEVIVDRKPLKNASGRIIGETLWVTPEAADAIRDAIMAQENL